MKTLSEEHKKNIGLALSNRKHPPTCKHCESLRGRKISRELVGKLKKGAREWRENNPGEHKVIYASRKGQWTGDKNPRWNGGVAGKHKAIRSSREYTEWRKCVYKRDYWTCVKCDSKCDAKNIVAHHLKSFSDFPETRFDINNGVTMCRSCHINEHRDTAIVSEEIS